MHRARLSPRPRSLPPLPAAHGKGESPGGAWCPSHSASRGRCGKGSAGPAAEPPPYFLSSARTLGRCSFGSGAAEGLKFLSGVFVFSKLAGTKYSANGPVLSAEQRRSWAASETQHGSCCACWLTVSSVVGVLSLHGGHGLHRCLTL